MKTLIALSLLALSTNVMAYYDYSNTPDPVGDVYNGIYSGTNPMAQQVQAQRKTARAIEEQTRELKREEANRRSHDDFEDYKRRTGYGN